MTTGLAPVTPLHRDRPSRAQIEPAALRLLARHSAQILATARRYSATAEDAEDAYQRGVEILLTKAPSAREAELLPWLKTVVKHEAYAVRRASGRALPVEEPAGGEPDVVAWTDEHAERYERLRLGAEAMAGLKAHEIRCLVLKAEGLSYNEISAATGFSYTKVNRCITEGRRAFAKRLAGIESGAECERLAPLLSRLADGEAGAEDMQKLRPHLRNCLACRATLREYRTAPARAAALVPPVFAAAALPGGGPLAWLGGLLARGAELPVRMAEAAGLASAPKAAAVAASVVAVAGGGAATYKAVTPPDRVAPVPADAEVRAARAVVPAAPTVMRDRPVSLVPVRRPVSRRATRRVVRPASATPSAPAAPAAETWQPARAAGPPPTESATAPPPTAAERPEPAPPGEFGP